ncbi:hypothetical protein D3C80_2142430 [compost metagenome]
MSPKTQRPIIMTAPIPVPIAAPACSALEAAVSIAVVAARMPAISHHPMRILNSTKVYFMSFPKKPLLGFLN